MGRINVLQKLKEEKVNYKIIANDGYEFSYDFPDLDKAVREAIYLTTHNAGVQTVFVISQSVYTEYVHYECIDKLMLVRRDELRFIVKEVKSGIVTNII